MSDNALVSTTHSFSDMEKMATAIAKSGLFGMKTTEQALALMLVAQAEGRHPGRVAVDYHIISGRPALKADTMLARFQEAGGKVTWHKYADDEATATFSHPQGGQVTISWTIKMAQDAKLTGKDVWKQYPRAMLRARVISEGIRTVFPGILQGMYTPEEVQDFAEPKNITPPRQEKSVSAKPTTATSQKEAISDAEVTLDTTSEPELEKLPTIAEEKPTDGKKAAENIKRIRTELGKHFKDVSQMKDFVSDRIGRKIEHLTELSLADQEQLLKDLFG